MWIRFENVAILYKKGNCWFIYINMKRGVSKGSIISLGDLYRFPQKTCL
jgi:hypothetical protein